MKKTLAVSLLGSLVLAMAVNALAADRSNLIFGDRGVIVKHPSKVITPAARRDPSLTTIAGTLSDYPGDVNSIV